MKRLASLLSRATLCLLLCLALGAATAVAADQEKLNINTATVEQLAKVPGLNETLAQEIVKYREEMGDIKAMDELLEIKGMDKALLEKLQESIMIEGVSGSDCTC
jgi:competence protein ComEA